MPEKICGVYSITCLSNGKMYIGSSSHIHNRWLSHKSRLKNKIHSPILQNTYNKYGLNSFCFNILEICDLSNLIQREQYWYNHFKSIGYKMLNYSNIIENPTRGIPISQERKNHLSKILKGRPSKNKGRKITEETRKKMSIASTGRKMTQKNKDILSEINKKPKTIEHRQRLSQVKKELVGVKIVCLQTNEVFNSLIDAANKYGIKYQSIRQSILRKGKCKSLNFYYANHNLTNEEIKNIIETDLRKKKKNHNYNYKEFYRLIKGKKILSINTNKIFNSISEASEYFKKSPTSIRNYIINKKEILGERLTFIN